MPIYYQCVACREEIYLPDSKSGMLSSCPRCRLKFLAPAPNVQMVPQGGAVVPPPAPVPAPAPAPSPQTPSTASSRPAFAPTGSPPGGAPARRSPAPIPAPQPQTAPPPSPKPLVGSRPPLGTPAPTPRPAPAPVPAPAAKASPPAVAKPASPPAPKQPSPPPSYPRDAAKPPLYPLDASAPKESAGAAAARDKKFSGSGVFGIKSTDVPSLFGASEDTLAARPDELFADAIPSTPEHGMDDLDVPLDLSPSAVTREEDDGSDDEIDSSADEGGGVAVPVDEEPPSAADSALDQTDVVEALGADGTGADLISMDELFKKPSAPAKAPPAFGKGGVMPAPFLKPPAPAVEDEGSDPATEHAKPAAAASGPVPFALIPVEGIPDARFDLPGGGVYLLGRDKDAHVKILSTSVSRRHARIDATGGDHVLIDLGSANGTQVNGQSVARQALKDGDLIRMGKVILRYAGPGPK